MSTHVECVVVNLQRGRMYVTRRAMEALAAAGQMPPELSGEWVALPTLTQEQTALILSRDALFSPLTTARGETLIIASLATHTMVMAREEFPCFVSEGRVGSSGRYPSTSRRIDAN